MKPSPDQDPLLRDVLVSDDDFRAATLASGVAAMRSRRARRRTARALASITFVLLTAGFLGLHLWRTSRPAPPSPALIAASLPKTIEGTPIRILNDEELLNLFSNRPVALVGARGDRRLVLFDEGSAAEPSTGEDDATDGQAGQSEASSAADGS